MEGDRNPVLQDCSTRNFNPLPPHGGRRQTRRKKFRQKTNFNPLPPHGGRHFFTCAINAICHFNPLPPHGGRLSCRHKYLNALHFNPLPPHGGRRYSILKKNGEERISIHSLRMEGDFVTKWRYGLMWYFNPLPPHGGRPATELCICKQKIFQSTPSAWRETAAIMQHVDRCLFQSTPSAWRETMRRKITVTEHEFQSTPSAWRETRLSSCQPEISRYFNPLPPHGGRHWYSYAMSEAEAFQSTPSAWRETKDPFELSISATFQSTPSAWRETGRGVGENC